MYEEFSHNKSKFNSPKKIKEVKPYFPEFIINITVLKNTALSIKFLTVLMETIPFPIPFPFPFLIEEDSYSLSFVQEALQVSMWEESIKS